MTYDNYGQRGRKYRALCQDGRYRTATATGEADTWFSLPARVKAKGQSVTGYITGDENSETGLGFRVYLYRKNFRAILPDAVGT